MDSLTYHPASRQEISSPPCYQAKRLLSALLPLLEYARTHEHSTLWIPAILTILARREVSHG